MAKDVAKEVAAPKDDGIFRVEVKTGERKLIVSFAQLKEAIRSFTPRIDERSRPNFTMAPTSCKLML